MGGILPKTAAASTCPQLIAESGRQGIYDANTNDVRALEIIAIVTALVLLLVCANVANLLLSRAGFRQRELSVRLSMGATRARLIRQLLTESLILAGMGGALGILVAYSGQELLPAPIGSSGTFDVRALAVMTAVTALVGVVFGIAPALQATRIDIGTSLKESSRSVTGSNSILSRSLLVAQVSISLVLLVGAGLFLRTLDNLKRVDIGYDPNNLVFVRTLPSTTEFDAAYRTGFFQQGMERLQSPAGRPGGNGVDADAALGRHEHAPACSCRAAFIPPAVIGRRNHHQPRRHRAEFFRDDGNFTRGRPQCHRTRSCEGAESRRHQPGSGAEVFPEREPDRSPVREFGGNVGDIEIVGVLRDVHYNSLRQAPPPTMYVPYEQRGPDGLIFTVRTAGDPAALMPRAYVAR